MRTQECFKCHKHLPLRDFYKHPYTSSGRLGKCKECTKIDVRANRALRRDFYIEYDRNRPNKAARATRKQKLDQTPKGRKKIFAARAARAAIKAGLLQRCPCEICGASDVEGHHDDYNKPLDVRWLCRSHHQAWHAVNKAKGV